MFTPSDLELMPKEIEQLYADLEMRIMQDVVRRIKINGEVTRSADWQINRLHELGESKKTIQKYLKDSLNLSQIEINKIYEDAIASGYARSEELYSKTGKQFIKYKNNKVLQQYISAVRQQTLDDFKNITQSLGFAEKINGRIQFTELADFYQKTLDSAMVDISSGAFDYNTVVKRTISTMTNSGLRSVDYATGWNNRIEVAVRRAVMTGVTQVTGKINEDNAKELDTEHFEVSWHADARPTHQVWQGKVYKKDELESICGLGTVSGLGGANCRHTYYPFIPGISERSYTDEQLANMNKKENEKESFGGKEYTSYEASQRMRNMEAAMRAQRAKIKLLNDAGVDDESIIEAKCKYRAISNQYASFAKEMGLPQERQRVLMDGAGRLISGKTPVVIKQRDINIHRSVGAAAKNYDVKLPDGGITKLTEGTKITKVYTFAGKGTNRKINVAEHLEKQYNVPASEWKKVRGDGYVDDSDKSRHVELHWFESEPTGRIKMKVKRYFDEG